MALFKYTQALIFLCVISLNTSYAQSIDPIVDDTLWYDALDIGVVGQGWKDTQAAYDRLPAKAKDMVRQDVWDLGHDTAGMLVRFKTNAKTINVRWQLTDNQLALPHMPATAVSGIDLYATDDQGKLRFVANGRPNGMLNEASFDVFGSDEYVLYLPLYNGIKFMKIGIPKGSTLSNTATPSRQIVFYGTSITQGGTVSRPGMAGTSIIAREIDATMINLGFSCNGKMEIELAELLAELDPAVYVLDCLWNMTPDQVSNRVAPFIKRLRLSHPSTPIILAEDSSYKNLPTEKGDIVRKIYKNLTDSGDENLYFLANTNMLGTDHDGTVDGVHPNDLGMRRQSNVFIEILKKILD
ncbi:MAG: hypothetical protein HOH19_09940 [Kordiimonadaceae bacterium]|jgi:hypothetical protein|nr:hypothetical protein [Kordiimonadaceae bacterium]MBT6032884.1 hypothetical protein [Kordiimonadaceae bacterium]